MQAALLQRDSRQHQALEDVGGGTVLPQPTPTGHSGMSNSRQRPDEGAVLGGKTDGDHIESKFDGAVKLQQRQVAVGAGLVVALVDQDLRDSPLLLRLLILALVMFTFTGRKFL